MRSAGLFNGRHAKFWQVSKETCTKKAYAYFNARWFIFFQSEISSLEILRVARDYIYIRKNKNSFPSSSKWREVIRETNCQQLARIQSGFEGTIGLSGRSIILINERGEEKNWSKSITVWVMNRGSLVRGNLTCSIIDYRVHCTISRIG